MTAGTALRDAGPAFKACGNNLLATWWRSLVCFTLSCFRQWKGRVWYASGLVEKREENDAYCSLLKRPSQLATCRAASTERLRLFRILKGNLPFAASPWPLCSFACFDVAKWKRMIGNFGRRCLTPQTRHQTKKETKKACFWEVLLAAARVDEALLYFHFSTHKLRSRPKPVAGHCVWQTPYVNNFIRSQWKINNTVIMDKVFPTIYDMSIIRGLSDAR